MAENNRQEGTEVTWYYSTMKQLFRDLHVAAVGMRHPTQGKYYVNRYVDTVVLIWETINGRPMTTGEALDILCGEFTKEELADARYIPKRKGH